MLKQGCKGGGWKAIAQFWQNKKVSVEHFVGNHLVSPKSISLGITPILVPSHERRKPSSLPFYQNNSDRFNVGSTLGRAPDLNSAVFGLLLLGSSPTFCLFFFFFPNNTTQGRSLEFSVFKSHPFLVLNLGAESLFRGSLNRFF